MVEAELPNAQQRRKQLQDGAADLGQTGAAFFEAGRWGEALECLAAAGDGDGLVRLAGFAIESGDYWLYSQAMARAGKPPDPADLESIQKNAKKLGKGAFAMAAEAALKPANEDTNE